MFGNGCVRKISKEIYDRNKDNRGAYMCDADMQLVFTDVELYGYGVYGAIVFEKDGNYFVKYETGSTCD